MGIGRTEGNDTRWLGKKHYMQFNTGVIRGGKNRYGGERTGGLCVRKDSGMKHAAPPYGFLLILYSGKLFLHFTLAKTTGIMPEQKNRGGQWEGAQCQAEREREIRLITISAHTHFQKCQH